MSGIANVASADPAAADADPADYERVLESRLRPYGSDIGYYARYKVGLMRRLVRQQPSDILDFGCGVGRSMRYLHLNYPAARLYGYDISPAHLEYARTRYPFAVFIDPVGIDAYANTFDLILVANVFHHVEVDARRHAMGLLARLASQHGEIFAFEHNPVNPVSVHLVKASPLDANAHLLHPGELIALGTHATLRLLGWGYCLFFPAALRMLSRIEPLLKRVPFGAQYYVQFARTQD